MNISGQPSNISLAPAERVSMLVRWRGRQEGPYSVELIEKKLSANEIGLLHEILHNGQWITIREYLAERKAMLRVQQQAREEQERRDREESEKQTKEREAQQRAELLAEERRKNDLLQASIAERQSNEPFRRSQPAFRKPHRAGTILALAIIGLFVFGPLCVVAWVMGNTDLREMDEGIMDNSGRSTTSSGRSIGILGTVLWIIAVIVLVNT